VKFRTYTRGSIVAERDPSGNTVLGAKHRGGILRAPDGVPRVVIERADVIDVALIFECIAGDLSREACARRGVAVDDQPKETP
jgi:hypothetical protein